MNINSPRDRGFAVPGLHGKPHGASTTSPYLRQDQFLKFLPTGFRNHAVAMLGEFAGTFLFLFFAFSGTQVANSQAQRADSKTIDQEPNLTRLLYISFCFGMSLALNSWVFFKISGGLFNPAVALGMALVGSLSWTRGALLVVCQVLGGITAAGVVLVLFPGSFGVRTSLGGGTSIIQGLFIEMFLTAQLVFTILILVTEKHKETFIAPIGVGISLFIAELTVVYFTGGAVNPARSFGPCVVLRSFHHYHWIYWIGPILGALLASAFYKFIKLLEHETSKRRQDGNEKSNHSLNLTACSSNPVVNLAPAEAPVILNHPNESFSVSDDEHIGQANISIVPDSGSNSVRQSSRLSDIRSSKGLGNESSVGHIYIDDPNLYTRGPEVEAARYVPRDAGHS